MPNITVNAIALKPDLYWSNEFSWSPITARETISVTGAAIIQRGKRIKGRRINLSSGDDTAWVTRAQLDALTALRDTKPENVTLTFGDGRVFQVIFNDVDGQSIEAEALQPGKKPEPSDPFRIKLNFLEVSV